MITIEYIGQESLENLRCWWFDNSQNEWTEVLLEIEGN